MLPFWMYIFPLTNIRRSLWNVILPVRCNIFFPAWREYIFRLFWSGLPHSRIDLQQVEKQLQQTGLGLESLSYHGIKMLSIVFPLPVRWLFKNEKITRVELVWIIPVLRIVHYMPDVGIDGRLLGELIPEHEKIQWIRSTTLSVCTCRKWSS